MDLIKSIGIGTSLELIVTALICWGFTQLFKQTFVNNKWAPWFSAAVGVVAGIIISVWQKDTVFTGAILGLLVGFATSGLFNGFKAFFGTIESKTDSKTNESKKTAEPISLATDTQPKQALEPKPVELSSNTEQIGVQPMPLSQPAGAIGQPHGDERDSAATVKGGNTNVNS
ncbi:hypothetical protein ACNAN0_02570 [Agrilactobacillus fermenti]|uniref:hypothetical protein n=1 Tax=Agrilactobacillus fermenti TaxID=2586909 RepID=UPI001E53600C|nr:hypothetical protein [Agrilactobacillus fermenti]MCD2256400.1 hypothetical protein [Agrilactobacillus fermenti]